MHDLILIILGPSPSQKDNTTTTTTTITPLKQKRPGPFESIKLPPSTTASQIHMLSKQSQRPLHQEKTFQNVERQLKSYVFSSWGVSKNRGTPKWMVKIMENPINPWMIWGYHYFRKHPVDHLGSPKHPRGGFLVSAPAPKRQREKQTHLTVLMSCKL